MPKRSGVKGLTGKQTWPCRFCGGRHTVQLFVRPGVHFCTSCGNEIKRPTQKETRMPLELDERETGTVIAALRHWQTLNDAVRRNSDLATENGEPLDDDEIDELCERINLGG